MSSVMLSEEYPIYLNSFCFGYRPNPGVLYPVFAKYYFRSQDFRSAVVSLAQGSTRYNISKVSLMKFDTLIPNIEEQRKIATFLSQIDEKITLETKKLESLKKFKKALLQRMFV